ncbi:MAG: serine protease, partial [Bacteroidota bacterium]|nr:serine protease [Bacteroidota bacterium]
DIVTGNTSFGEQVRIMAPGYANYTTTNDNSYTNSGSRITGTSFASPVVAGVVALVRARHPEMTALQALEFTRQCTDDISQDNSTFKDYLPGRVNALKAMQTDPFSIPGIAPLDAIFTDNSGVRQDRFIAGDTVHLTIKAMNYLGAANNLRFVLSKGYDFSDVIKYIDTIVNISQLQENENFDISKFKFLINFQDADKILFRIDIYGENNYHDFFLVPFIPTSDMATFENGAIKFSVGDRGNLGFYKSGENKQGVGFVIKGQGNFIYNAGMMACESNMKAISSIYGYGPYGSDFSVIKPFSAPERYIGIMDDSKDCKRKDWHKDYTGIYTDYFAFQCCKS